MLGALGLHPRPSVIWLDYCIRKVPTSVLSIQGRLRAAALMVTLVCHMLCTVLGPLASLCPQVSNESCLLFPSPWQTHRTRMTYLNRVPDPLTPAGSWMPAFCQMLWYMEKEHILNLRKQIWKNTKEGKIKNIWNWIIQSKYINSIKIRWVNHPVFRFFCSTSNN